MAKSNGNGHQQLTAKIGAKGGVSVYGLSARFPVTLYADQWLALLDHGPKLREYIEKELKAGNIKTKVQSQESAGAVAL